MSDVPGIQEVVGDTPLARFLKLAVAQVGDPYDTAHGDAASNDVNPGTFDCSELVQWAAHGGGATVGEATYFQYFELLDKDALLDVGDALDTPGALLFSFRPPPVRGQGRPEHAHVAISLGNGQIVEAPAPGKPIQIVDGTRREWTYGGVIPEFRDQTVDLDDVLSWVGRDDEVQSLLQDVPIIANPAVGSGQPLPTDRRPVESSTTPADGSPGTTPANGSPGTGQAETDPAVRSALAEASVNKGAGDTDRDALPDHFELRYGLDAHVADTDGDGITDGYELIELGTDPLLADSDFDGLSDGSELSLGLDPTVADNPDVDAGWNVPDSLLLDSDGDGIADWGEKLAGTRIDDADSDDDGVLDGDELMNRSDPLSAG